MEQDEDRVMILYSLQLLKFHTKATFDHWPEGNDLD